MKIVEIQQHPLKNINKNKLESVKGIILYLNTDYYDSYEFKDNYFKNLTEENKGVKNFGYHYVVMQNKIANLVDEKYSISPKGDKPTYINSNLYNGKAKENMICVDILFGKNANTEIIDMNTIRFISELLKKYKLTHKDVWRARDLYDDAKSPIHYLENRNFRSMMEEIKKFIPEPKPGDTETEDELLEDTNFDEIEFKSSFWGLAQSGENTIDYHIRKIIESNIVDVDKLIQKNPAWDKNIAGAKNDGAATGQLQTKEFKGKNTMQFTITQTSPSGSCSCDSAADKIDMTFTTSQVLVEPVYPDIIAPPGETLIIAQESGIINHQNAETDDPRLDDFENKQTKFDFEGFEDASKETTGRPVNPEDPFPVDIQIKKLEEHFPKVKIDKINSNFDDTNHMNSTIGQATAKNLAMIYDILEETTKRTETRLVKIENNLSTVMRNLFRMSSRININCCYYGGQSIYSKYSAIRCLDDKRIHDGAVVTLDQCLSCSRYEPIDGQVYAILDDTGSNVTQVIDDIQMAYMSTQDFMDMSKIENYSIKKESAKLKKNVADNPPKPFIKSKWKDNKKEEENKLKNVPKEKLEEVKKNYKNGFVMEWTPTSLELQSPNIVEYDLEKIDISKPIPNKEELAIEDALRFEDTRKDAIEYEKLEFNINDYSVDGFGNASGSSSGDYVNEALIARNKIVEYVNNAVKMCDDSKAKFSKENRWAHEGQKGAGSIDGISYWDDASLVYEAYASAGVILKGDTSANIYPSCKKVEGGKFILIKDISKAKAGDMIFFKENAKVSKSEELEKLANASVTSIGIYIGDNSYITVLESEDESAKNISIKKIGDLNTELCLGSPKALLDLDRVNDASGFWTREYHNIPDDMWETAKMVESNAAECIKNMEKYKYREAVISAGKETGYDPYLILAIAAAESNGDPLKGPYMGTAKETGIMQCSGGATVTAVDDIRKQFVQGMTVISRKKATLKQFGWTEEHLAVLVNAYNMGEGGVLNALGYLGKEKYGMPVVPMDSLIPAISDAVHNYCNKYNIYGGDKGSIRRAYLTKILRAYRYLYDRDVLKINNRNTGWYCPVPKEHRITSHYGVRRHPVTGKPGTFHRGIDIGSPGGTPIKAAKPGTVTFAGASGSGYGNLVKIKHADNYETRYAHCQSIHCKVGEKVDAGNLIAKVGTTGNSTGNHLHFEIRVNDDHKNPALLVKEWENRKE